MEPQSAQSYSSWFMLVSTALVLAWLTVTVDSMRIAVEVDVCFCVRWPPPLVLRLLYCHAVSAKARTALGGIAENSEENEG